METPDPLAKHTTKLNRRRRRPNNKLTMPKTRLNLKLHLRVVSRRKLNLTLEMSSVTETPTLLYLTRRIKSSVPLKIRRTPLSLKVQMSTLRMPRTKHETRQSSSRTRSPRNTESELAVLLTPRKTLYEMLSQKREETSSFTD